MNKIMLAMLPFLFPAFTYKAMAQDEGQGKDGKKEMDEIVIRKKGQKDMSVTIQINGDQVLVNGKPMMEFKDDGITINKRKIIIRDGERMMFGEDFPGVDMPGNFSWTDDGGVKRAFLGVNTQKHDDGGAQITNVTDGSAAAKAGLEIDDIITKVNGKSVDGPQSLAEVIGSMKPGDIAKINYTRKGKSKTLKATLGERKDKSTVRSFSFSGPDGSFKTFTMPSVPGQGEWKEMFPNQEFDLEQNFERNMERFGDLESTYRSFPRRQKLGLRIQDTEEGTGVKVIDVEDSSAAAKAGMLKDDIITEIAGVKVSNTDDAREQLMENNEKSAYTIKARRNGTDMVFNIKIPKKLKTANL